ncbi:MAG: hypothetical protein II822_01405, partial [Prevotella sp.]|nr:hypothetical protein [Prevotella sp.]
MKKIQMWMSAAILTLCGATMLTSCSNADNPSVPENPALAEALVGEWIFEQETYIENYDLDDETASLADGCTMAILYHFNDDGTCWKEINLMKDGKLVDQPVSRFATDESTYTVDAGGKVVVTVRDIEAEGDESDVLTFDGTRLTTRYANADSPITLVRATDAQILLYKDESDAWHGGSAETKYNVADYKPKGVDNSRWMKQLKDSRLVCDLSLPGSHDACTAEGWINDIIGIGAEIIAKCQDLTIREQLKIGVRVFDLRPERVLDSKDFSLRCSHGPVATKMLASEFFTTLQQWLKANPSEFCIVTVDLSATRDKTAWGTEFSTLVNDAKYNGLFADFKSRLTVGEMRGRVLILSKWEYGAKPLGGYCYGWGSYLELEKQKQGYIIAADGNRTPLWVQDYWEDITRTNKDQALVRMLEAAVSRDMTASAPAWVINYPS